MRRKILWACSLVALLYLLPYAVLMINVFSGKEIFLKNNILFDLEITTVFGGSSYSSNIYDFGFGRRIEVQHYVKDNGKIKKSIDWF